MLPAASTWFLSFEKSRAVEGDAEDEDEVEVEEAGVIEVIVP